jgi:hypothetical protein
MIHQTSNETTPNLYESNDGLVSVRILDDPRRYPRHNYQVVVFRFTPKAHTRIRDLGNGMVEFLPDNEELGAFLAAFDKANGKFPLSSGLPLKNKPPERAHRWQRNHQRRLSQRRFYHNNRRH